jgi:hypothetical protein
VSSSLHISSRGFSAPYLPALHLSSFEHHPAAMYCSCTATTRAVGRSSIFPVFKLFLPFPTRSCTPLLSVHAPRQPARRCGRLNPREWQDQIDVEVTSRLSVRRRSRETKGQLDVALPFRTTRSRTHHTHSSTTQRTHESPQPSTRRLTFLRPLLIAKQTMSGIQSNANVDPTPTFSGSKDGNTTGAGGAGGQFSGASSSFPPHLTKSASS